MHTIKHISGATFSLTGTVLLPAGEWSATCHVKNLGSQAVVKNLTVTLTPRIPPTSSASHNIQIETSPSDLEIWPAGSFVCDVRFADASTPPIVIPSDVFAIECSKGVTNG